MKKTCRKGLMKKMCVRENGSKYYKEENENYVGSRNQSASIYAAG